MNIKGETYYLDRVDDMIKLAQFVQSKVYWGTRFYLCNDNDMSCHYSTLWECVEYYRGLKCSELFISEDDYITFS